MDEISSADHFGASTYGRSFADVYDEWYPADDNSGAAVEFVSRLCPEAGKILELGVGTGRIALQLAAMGHHVVGMDASVEMLTRLNAKAEQLGLAVEGVEADVADPTMWPKGSFDVVLAAFNLIFNLESESGQRSLFHSAASAVRPGGAVVVEAFIPAAPAVPPTIEKTLEVRDITPERVVLIASEWQQQSGVVNGAHIELRDSAPVKLRPWRIRVASPETLDLWATEAGLSLAERHSDWNGGEFVAHGVAHVSVYRRSEGR